MEIIYMFAYLVFIGLVVEISATFFVFTGLDKHIARYQAISMLTNTGFTTDEAKLILDHPIRRKLSSFLILFGAFSLAVIISILSAYLANDVHVLQISIVMVSTAIFFILLKTKFVRAFLEKRLHEELENTYELDELPLNEVLYLNKDEGLIDIPFHTASSYLDENYSTLLSDNENIRILFVKRGTNNIRYHIEKEKIKSGDLLYIYGNKKLINEKFKNELEEKKSKEETEISS
ncbi:hypothetical protein [Lederbergia citri]|uniref:RCK C-terminal domain-containing protein n=1 Tax=Lederbergia citri TaxID=2833580 RepID=A0A942YII0_9BACI|nr:hypothetical protein [Lederbergia citri]MBS4195396.1 hypothetical protein [Lederbergia citri]